MVATTFRCVRFPGGGCFQLGDLHAELFRAFDEMFPGERARPLGGELIVKRHGIMVVEQDEMIADRKVKPGAYDEAVLDGARDWANVHYSVCASEVFGWWCCVH